MKTLYFILFFSCLITVNFAQETPQVDETKLEFLKHKVRKKETLFSISQKYNVQVADIKRFNKELYARKLKKREVLRIPIGLYALENTSTLNQETTTTTTDSLARKTHTVLAKETKYGIARKYGITIAELESMNPTMGQNLQIGVTIIVPATVKVQDTATEDDFFEYYEVQAKEGFYRLTIKLGLSQEEIITLNPYAKDGLKEGMILKIPRDKTVIEGNNFKTVNLEDAIVNTKKKTIAVMLPFKLSAVNIDSLEVNKALLKTDATLRVALDFYTGVLMAGEFAKDKGITTHLEVYDTEASPSKVSTLLAETDFSEVDAVIGPLLSKNIEKTSASLQPQNIPVFSPLSKVQIKQTKNLYQTQPAKEAMQKSMLDYIVKNAGDKNIVVITGNTWTKEKGEIVKALPQAKTISASEGNFIKLEDIIKQTDTVRENWMILTSDNPILVSNVVGLLNGLPEDILDEEFKKIGSYNIRLFTLHKNKAFDYNDVSNIHLANLNFTYPSVSKHHVYDKLDPFLVSYKNKYGVYPNKYAIRGFDVTYDVLLRLASAESIEKATYGDLQTEYVESKFQYSFHENQGYINNAFYIIKYTKELKLEVIK